MFVLLQGEYGSIKLTDLQTQKRKLITEEKKKEKKKEEAAFKSLPFFCGAQLTFSLDWVRSPLMLHTSA